MKTRVSIKPLSVNKAWQGRRFKTEAYKSYEREMLYSLSKQEIPNGELCLKITFGYSNRASDVDNGVKPLLDILQKKHGFDDKRIYEMHVRKTIVPKGEEFIEYEIIGDKSILQN